jgi:Flp pilus assembly protein TadD
MEYVDGVSLRHLLTAKKLSSREALAIVPQICDALQYAHDQGIVHRDIKPENILLVRQGRVKVADFGLAKLVKTESALLPEIGGTTPSGDGAATSATEATPGGPSLTQPGTVMGTPRYMAPEQREHPTDVDHRADIYSLGVVFYEMLTGELPQEPIKPPSKKAALDARLDEVVMGSLAKERQHRYQQASLIKNDVEAIAATPVSASVSSETVSEPTPALSNAGAPAIAASLAMNHNIEPNSPLKSTRRTALIASLLTAFVLCTVIGLVWLLKTKPAPKEVVTEPMSSQEALELTAQTISPVAPGVTFDALNNQGNDLLFKKNDAASAVPVFEACIRDYPNRSEGYHGLALAQRETGRRAEAISNHDRAIELTPNRADYYYARAQTYVRLNNYDMAMSDFEMGLKQKPIACLAPGMLEAGLAVCYRAKGDLETALKQNEEACALNPENSWIQYELTATRQAIAERDRAVAALKEQAESQTKPE